MRYLVILFLLFNAGLVEAQPRYAVLITEIMADPSPTAGLPGYEWIEIKNTSHEAIDLKGWKIGDEAGISGAVPVYILYPDSMLILTTTAALPSMSIYGKAITISNFPSLDNEGDLIYIQNAQGTVIHAVNYSNEWYRNSRKQEGGWSLEMVNTLYPCSKEENWQASLGTYGGTPGKVNSITNTIPEIILPTYQRIYAESPDTIVVVFDRSIDSISASIPTNYMLPAGFNILHSSALPPMFNSIRLVLNKPINENKTYPIEINNLRDCMGNIMTSGIKILAGLAEDPKSLDCIINEVLFNPPPGGSDYVEIFNNSDKVIDLSRLAIANRNSSGIISSIQRVTQMPFYFFPNEYLVLSEDPGFIPVKYMVKDRSRLQLVKSMPSFPDEVGSILLLNFQGETLDELKYTADWHFKLLRELEGIALERLDKNAKTQLQSNWHSAASAAGYGTPGYENSQNLTVSGDGNAISVSPKYFSPDLDGRDDILKIEYKLNTSDNVANVWIYNESGICVRNLVRNATVSKTGYWTWDGLDEKGNPIEPGNYILLTELFNLQGKKSRLKNLLIVVKKFS